MLVLKLTIPVSQVEQSEILIAQLTEIGFEGFSEPLGFLEAFIPVERFNPAEADQIIRQAGLNYTVAEVPQTNWNEEWEKSFQPVRIGDFCQIRAEFHPQDHRVKYDLLIQPKMSFGTGHHATTALMIESMRTISLKGANLLDFGTGTGVLAILAEKMGALSVLAVDNDDWSIRNAYENLEKNQCSRIMILQSDRIPLSGPSFTHILANVNRNVILSQLSMMEQQLTKGGVLVISGILKGDLPGIREKASHTKLVENDMIMRESWVAVQYLKP